MGVPGIPRRPSVPRFFLSYASADSAKDGLLHQFADDLQAAVADRLRITSEDAGFIDKEGIRSGQLWADRLGWALRNSRVLVCLVSADYLSSVPCGKELHVFIKRRERNKADNPQVIIPIIWDPRRLANALPEALRQFQLTDPGFPVEYNRQGTRGLALSAPIEYRALITALTTTIVTGADYELGEWEAQTTWDELENALAPAAPPRSDNSSALHIGLELVRALGSSRPFEAKFIYITPELEELPQLRTRAEFYATGGGWYWSPYQPQPAEHVGQIVNRASVTYRQESLSPRLPDLVRLLTEAAVIGQAVVLIVDAWATLVPSLRNVLGNIDRAGLLNYAVIIVRNSEDPETMQQNLILEDGLRLAFPFSYAGAARERFCRDVYTREELEKAVAAVLAHIRRSVEDRRAAQMRLAGSALPSLAPQRVA